MSTIQFVTDNTHISDEGISHLSCLMKLEVLDISTDIDYNSGWNGLGVEACRKLVKIKSLHLLTLGNYLAKQTIITLARILTFYACFQN